MRSSVLILGHYCFFSFRLGKFQAPNVPSHTTASFYTQQILFILKLPYFNIQSVCSTRYFYFLKRSLIFMLRCKPSCMNIAFTVIMISPIIWLPALVPLCKNNMSLSFQLLVKMLFRLVQIDLYAFQHQFSYTTCLIMRCRITLSKTLSTMRVKVN